MEFLSLPEAIARHVQDGDTVALEGFTHLIPFAAGHEIIRQVRRNLTLIRMTPDIIYDQMIGMGVARRLVFSWGGNPGVGSLHRLRDAVGAAGQTVKSSNIVTQQWPTLMRQVHRHAFFRGYRGSELASVNGQVRFVKCPFTGEELACIPAHRPDVAIIHAQKADREGNVLMEGIVGVQKEAALAARCAIATVEEIVDGFGPRSPNAAILPSWTMAAVVCVPGGARPSYAYGYYSRDNSFYIAWDAIARERDTFRLWMQQNVVEHKAGE
jgi:glutaconate CoA-transferase subunit A